MHIHVVAEHHYEEMLGDKRAVRKMIRNYRRLSEALRRTGDKILILPEPYIETDRQFKNPKHRIAARFGKLVENAIILPVDSGWLKEHNASQILLLKDLQKEKERAKDNAHRLETLEHVERIKKKEFLDAASIRSKIMAKNILKALELTKKNPELQGINRIIAIVGAAHAPEVMEHLVKALGDRVGDTIYIHGNGVEPEALNAKGDIVLHIHDVTADQSLFRSLLGV